MAIIVVGGHSRNVGKTSVVAGLIAALPGFHWTAFKITQYGHGMCSLNGEACACVTADHSWAVTEEKNHTGDTDTARFLSAGAARVYWARTEQGKLAEAMPAIRRRLGDAENVIIESNSIMKFLKPDLYLTVLDPKNPDFKKSAQEFIDRADAVLMHPFQEDKQSTWSGVSLKPVQARPHFEITPPDYLTNEVVEFVRSRLSGVPRSSSA